jgi:hypothetical protein
MNEAGLAKLTLTARLMLRILTYAALLFVVIIIGFFPIVSNTKISLKMIYSSTPGHQK